MVRKRFREVGGAAMGLHFSLTFDICVYKHISDRPDQKKLSSNIAIYHVHHATLYLKACDNLHKVEV